MTIDTKTLALNAVCPYYTMFPLSFPLGVLGRQARRGQWVLDPFCGRGTTNFAARTIGLSSIGLDSSAVAVALASAKLRQVTTRQVVATAVYILHRFPTPSHVPRGEFWQRAYERETLKSICRLRDGLLAASDTDATRVLRAIVLGALHGPRAKTLHGYFSNQCPRTFAPKPNYSVGFWRSRRLVPPAVDVLDVIRRRAKRFLTSQPASADGEVRLADSRDPQAYHDLPSVSWVITSPPYYGMRTYIQDQWLRNWFVGGPEAVPYQAREADMSHSSPEAFAQQLSKVWTNVLSHCNDGARLIARFGGIQDRHQDPSDIFTQSLKMSGWKLVTRRVAGTALDGRRQASQFAISDSAPRLEYHFYAMAV